MALNLHSKLIRLPCLSYFNLKFENRLFLMYFFFRYIPWESYIFLNMSAVSSLFSLVTKLSYKIREMNLYSQQVYFKWSESVRESLRAQKNWTFFSFLFFFLHVNHIVTCWIEKARLYKLSKRFRYIIRIFKKTRFVSQFSNIFNKNFSNKSFLNCRKYRSLYSVELESFWINWLQSV